MTDSWLWPKRLFLIAISTTLAIVAIRAILFNVQDSMPDELRIATGKPAGMYHLYSELLQKTLELRGQKVSLAATEGTVDNVQRLQRGEVDLALVQAGAVSMHDLAVVAPVAKEIVHVVARLTAGIKTINELRGKRVILGRQTSGMHTSAMQVLSHYGIREIDMQVHDGYFMDLMTNTTLDAAIVTTGFENSDLQTLLKSAAFELIPIDDADALALKHPHFQHIEIPKGLYHEHPTEPAIPHSPTTSVTTTALLVCRPEAPGVMVREVLNALYDHDLQEKLSGLLPRDVVLRSTKQRWHKEAREYFDPFDQIGYMANVMESLAALKDLFWATGGLIGMAYILWRKHRARKRRNHLREKRQKHRACSQAFKDQLDTFLKETIAIEQELGRISDPRTLEGLLQKLSEVKLRALNELTEETLRGNRMFLIFLQQCGHLSQAVRGKIWLSQPLESRSPHDAPSNDL